MLTTMMSRTGLRVAAVALLGATGSGCFAFVTKEEGRELKQQIEDVRTLSAKNELRAAELAKELDEQLKRLRSVVDEATKVVTRNSADVGLQVQKQQTDLAQLTGRIDDLQHAQDALTKQFQDYRAASDTKLEQLVNASTTAKNPPMPETPDALFAEGEKRLQAQQFQDARRLFEGFVNRYPADPRAARAQFNIGEAYAGEKRYANAIGAYTKVVDNFPKSDAVPDAMFKNGLAFYQLKYCGDAKVYFQELIKRYPKTTWKAQANEQLKKLTKDQKNHAVCAS
jgi:tol-pal system protein YbgF